MNDDERLSILEDALDEAYHLAEFLDMCLRGEAEHAYPSMTRATLDRLKPIVEQRVLVCVLCGTPWETFSNRCVGEGCRGFCTWGKAKGAKAISWVDYERKIPEPVPPLYTSEPKPPCKGYGQ